MTNSTLSPATIDLPNFTGLDIQQLQQAIESKIQDGLSLLADIQAQDNFADALNTVNHFEAFCDEFGEDYSILSHLDSVMNSPEIRDIYQAILPKVSDFYTQIGQHQALYQNYQLLADHADFATLRQAQQAAIRHAIRDFKLSGVALPPTEKQRFAEIAARLSQLGSDFSNHDLDATQAFMLPLNDDDLAGLPESSIELLKQYGKQRNVEQPVATLDAPSYISIMTYADKRELREKIYHAYVTTASELSDDGKFDNSAIMQEILALRAEKAKLLGFDHYADLSLARKMAPSVAKVQSFLYDLADKARPVAEQELKALQAIAAEDGIDHLQAWDTGYYAEKLKQKQFNLSQEALKPYFPSHKVMQGLFATIEKLYSIHIIEKQADTWHDDVRYYEVEDHGKVIGGFYTDLYARDNKMGGAWMNGFRAKINSDQQQQLPVAFIVGSFTPPLNGKPALLTHDEVITLFHEFGHGLHHVLTTADHSSVSGTTGVAWDAVELPSQFMEFWGWQTESLNLLSSHIDTGEVLPQDLLDALLAVRHFQTGLQTLRQLEFSLFDLDIHQQVPSPDVAGIQATLDRIRSQVALIIPPSYNRFQHGFTHIFAGGYAAGYYSYKWAEVLASDAFDRFEQEGIFNVETGKAFRNSVLAVGGMVDALDAFKAFRGREPEIDALLRHNGWTLAQ
ncbi:M3 family metallopeptidase [Acinetobacter sp. c3-l95]|uniref:M3 family metallopeptidase n=1 Tax=Acinetobacter sp. c3-l95 TaxID=3342804 RepID=UPI0035BB262F